MRTYINAGVLDYLNTRYDSAQMPRIAVVPFNVPETFAPTGNESGNYGRQLAHLFHRELLKTGEFSIVELFNRDTWPGKRAEFSTGNYTAIQLAKNAGYDLIILGYMEDLKNDSDIVVQSKIIDTSNSSTIWYSRTVAYSERRKDQSRLAGLSKGDIKYRPDLFYLPERAEMLAQCTVNSMIKAQPNVPVTDKIENKGLLGILKREPE